MEVMEMWGRGKCRRTTGRRFAIWVLTCFFFFIFIMRIEPTENLKAIRFSTNVMERGNCCLVGKNSCQDAASFASSLASHITCSVGYSREWSHSFSSCIYRPSIRSIYIHIKHQHQPQQPPSRPLNPRPSQLPWPPHHSFHNPHPPPAPSHSHSLLHPLPSHPHSSPSSLSGGS